MLDKRDELSKQEFVNISIKYEILKDIIFFTNFLNIPVTLRTTF